MIVEPFHRVGVYFGFFGRSLRKYLFVTDDRLSYSSRRLTPALGVVCPLLCSPVACRYRREADYAVSAEGMERCLHYPRRYGARACSPQLPYPGLERDNTYGGWAAERFRPTVFLVRMVPGLWTPIFFHAGRAYAVVAMCGDRQSIVVSLRARDRQGGYLCAEQVAVLTT
jgi:hypothetical protein